VTSAGDIGNYARDVQISTELKSKLLLDKHVLSINYAVTTVDQVIYLLGIAQDLEERERVNNYARALPYVKKVVNHVILKDDPRRKPS
jgi:osmotically-inducible protein OsmY